ncbi:MULTISPECIES: hypothetical protein [unclassified Caballeronia]|uniref:hypothetical protein n=1 Tax=unclassified Caballeronia TaxID=2646786 RepID=UPI0020277BDF|nr:MULTISPECIES: hypothetical protein [unclassified Caballeronia]MDR5802613.1 hypothetical protein [Caballeronia sp. LZ001]
MFDLPMFLVGLAALAAISIVLLADDWRDARRERMARRELEQAAHHPLREWWLRHRH